MNESKYMVKLHLLELLQFAKKLQQWGSLPFGPLCPALSKLRQGYDSSKPTYASKILGISFAQGK